jgi:hypothetical protein
MEAFAIFRAEKIDQGTETAAHNHNLRASKTKKENNVDYSKSHLNEILLGGRNTVAIINQKVEQRTNKKKLRADANRAIEFVLSASPEHFYDFEKVGMTREEWDNLTPANFKDRMGDYWNRLNEVKATLKQDKLEQWKHDTVEWVKKEFGQNVVNLVLHLDEKTPHAHLLAVPLTKEGKLSAKDFFNPATATRWQDDYAQATKLKRGIASERKHEELKAKEFQLARERGYELGKSEGLKFGKAEGFKQGKAEAKEIYKTAKQDGYKKGKEQARETYKNAKHQGYEKGYQVGLEQSQKLGAKVGSLWGGLKDTFSKPTPREKQFQRDAEEAIAEAKKKQTASEEEARKAKLTADNRVSKVDELLKAEQDKVTSLGQDLDRAQEKIKKLRELVPPPLLRNRKDLEIK